MKARALTGMPVISVAEGVKAGRVSDLTIAATSPWITALILKTEREQTILPFEAIRQIGPDAIMIDKLGVVRAEAASDSGEDVRRFTMLVGKETASDDGTYLGDLKDLDIDRDTGRIDVLLLHRGGVMGIGGDHITVPGTHLHAFGPKLLTVAPPIADEDRSVARDEARAH